jgi:hypothetical protein
MEMVRRPADQRKRGDQHFLERGLQAFFVLRVGRLDVA